MTNLLRSLLVIIVFTFSTILIWGQDKDAENSASTFKVSQEVQAMLNQIRDAENNGDWQAYKSLREQIIQKLRVTNPELAEGYNTVNIKTKIYSNQDEDITSISNSNYIKGNVNIIENSSPIVLDWGNDVVFYESRSLTDFSMDVSYSGDIYVSIATNNGTANDSLFIYKSDDGGLTWNLWATRYTTGDYNKTEIMCFDSPTGAGEDYVLLFYTFSGGTTTQRFNAARYLMSDPTSLTVSTIALSDILDFAADRSYPATNYRAIVLFDSLNSIRCVRSDPASYGTVWVDKHATGYVGKDIDLCYGQNGSVYITYNGFNSGNLYARENLNYGDPASWSANTTLENGSTDTTQHAAVITSHQDQASINIQILYAKRYGNTFDLRRANKNGGSGTWTADISFITNNTWDVFFPSLYCTKTDGNTIFQSSYTMREYPTYVNRQVNQRIFDGSTWQGSQTISDYLPTGLQKSYVAELNGEPIVLYTGSNGNSLYFDNKGWPVPLPIINVNPLSLDFGGVVINSDSMMTFTINNTGTADLIVSNITSSDPAFTVNLTNATINPGAHQDVEVTFAPTSVTTYSGTIDITHNAAGSPTSITVTGQGNPIVGMEDNLFTQIPTEYTLYQNYPNPFNPSTSIVFGLPESREVTITLYNFVGQEVAVIFNGHKTAGYHQIKFNADNLPSGVYFYKITAGNFSSVKKMLLLK